MSLHRFSSCCWKAHSLPTSLCAQPTQHARALGHCETLALSLPALVLPQHPQYDSLHFHGGQMLPPCLMLGDPQGRDHRRLEASPLAPAQARGTAATGTQLGGAGSLPGLSREAGDRLHCIRAVTAGGGWDRDMRTWHEKEAPTPGLSTGSLLGSPNLSKSSGST